MKYRGAPILALAALLMCGASNVTSRADVAHGRYLVKRVMLCGDCHTPKIHGRPDLKRWLQGATLPFAVGPHDAKLAPSIAGLPAGWSKAQFVYFMETGVTPRGTHALHPMPPFRLDARDANSVADYLISLGKPHGASAGVASRKSASEAAR